VKQSGADLITFCQQFSRGERMPLSIAPAGRGYLVRVSGLLIFQDFKKQGKIHFPG
jgi:hypothetical protein